MSNTVAPWAFLPSHRSWLPKKLGTTTCLLPVLLCTVLCAAGCGRGPEDEARQVVKELGGAVIVDDAQSGGRVTRVTLFGPRVTDESVNKLKDLQQLQELDLGGSAVTDECINVLREFKNLQWLRLSNTGVTDVGLKGLKNFKQLRTLDLTNTGVTAVGAADLQKALPECKIYH
jgi:hypothetical protein